MILRILISAACLALGHQSAHANAYLDDRSTPEMLIRSLYNAINRQEYARAYSYFETLPAETLDAYAEGFADTESVDLVTGFASGDGGAGTFIYSLPVAIRAHGANGEERIYAGCYDLVFVSPGPQTTPYRPLMIREGHLSPATGALEEAVPEQCGDVTPDPASVLQDRAQRMFETSYSATCPDSGLPQDPDSYTITVSTDPQEEAWLIRYTCYGAAYNRMDLYFLGRANGEVRAVSFPTPELDIHYEDEQTQERVSEVNIIGYSAQEQLANSDFDPETLTMTTAEKWRGVGDASSSGVWIFRSGAFSLVRYDVDASYDGEINPETVLDYETGP
jgi:hypothetical protein